MPPLINEFAVQIAFDDDPLEPLPTWTSLDSVDGIRVQGWTVSRGRPNELEKTSAGTATVTVADRAGYFDPTNGGSPVYPNVGPDLQAAIQLWDPVAEEWQFVFRGFVEDISYDVQTVTYDAGAADLGVVFATLNLVDAFAWLNDYELMPYPSNGDLPDADSAGRVFYEDTAGTAKDRIDAILDEIGWPPELSDVFSMNVRLCETRYEPGTSALSALFDCVDAEYPGVANLYVSRSGIITAHGRQARFRPNVAEYGIQRRDVGDPSATILDDDVVPISTFAFAHGKAFLYNSVLVLPQDTGEDPTQVTPPTEAEIAGQLLEDTTSVTAHGKKGLTFTDLLTIEGVWTGNTALEECLLFATMYRDNYKDPLPRITRMTFRSRDPRDRLAAALWRMMCRCEISDLLSVTTSHVGGGGFADTGNQGYYVEGIRYTCRPGNDRVHDVTLEVDVSPQALFTSNPFDADQDPESS